MNRGTIASLLRQHYERILYPYDVFQSGATIGPDIVCIQLYLDFLFNLILSFRMRKQIYQMKKT